MQLLLQQRLLLVPWASSPESLELSELNMQPRRSAAEAKTPERLNIL